jgi:hypothetical protein
MAITRPSQQKENEQAQFSADLLLRLQYFFCVACAGSKHSGSFHAGSMKHVRDEERVSVAGNHLKLQGCQWTSLDLLEVINGACA